MAQVVSLLNLKGGVGKTTTTVALAHSLTADFGKHVLVIDLDPQASATIILIGEAAAFRVAQRDQTVAQVFRDALGGGPAIFNFDSAVQSNVGGVEGLAGIDLLASSAELYAVQEGLPLCGETGTDVGRAHAILHDAIGAHLADYDIVLIDCPPSLNTVTYNGLFLSDGFLIPTIPDVLSTHGIPVLLRRLSAFSRATGHGLAPIGLVATKMQANSRVHAETLKRLQTLRDLMPVYDTVIPQTNHIAAAGAFGLAGSIRQKWGHPALPPLFRALAGHVLARLDMVAPHTAVPEVIAA